MHPKALQKAMKAIAMNSTKAAASAAPKTMQKAMKAIATKTTKAAASAAPKAMKKRPGWGAGCLQTEEHPDNRFWELRYPNLPKIIQPSLPYPPQTIALVGPLYSGSFKKNVMKGADQEPSDAMKKAMKSIVKKNIAIKLGQK